MDRRDPVAERRKFVNAWNVTMIKIWKERIERLGVMDTHALLYSPVALNVGADGRVLNVELSQGFLEYGLWQDLGTGREVSIGNNGDIGREKKRQRRRWFSTKYYASVMNLRDFMAESLGLEFTGMFTKLDADELRRDTAYYRRKGLG